MLNYLIETSLCLLAFYICYYAFLKNDTFFQRNRFFLLFSSLISLIIPLMEFDFGTSGATVSYTLQTVTVGIHQAKQGFEGFSFFSILTVIYLSVTTLLLFRYLWQLFSLYQLIRNSEVKHRRGYRLIDTEGKYPTFSFLNYLFWDNSRTLSEEEADKILGHELKHIWDKHSYDLIYIDLLKIFFWFNPVIYLYARSLRFLHEYIADASVLEETDSKTYGKMIVQAFFSKLNLSLAHGFNQSEIKQRLKIMNKMRSPAYLNIKLLVVLPLMAFLIFAFSSKINSINENASSEKTEMNRFATAEGGLDKFYAELSQILLYPTQAKQAGIEGKVFIQFTVMQDGTLADIEVIKGLHPACDKAALEAVKKANTKWLPAKVDGRAVKQSLSVPISFK